MLLLTAYNYETRTAKQAYFSYLEWNFTAIRAFKN